MLQKTQSFGDTTMVNPKFWKATNNIWKDQAKATARFDDFLGYYLQYLQYSTSLLNAPNHLYLLGPKHLDCHDGYH